MAVVASRPSVTTTATLIASNDFADTGSATASDVTTKAVRIKNFTGTVSVFLGPSGVTTANGYEWTTAEGPIQVELEPGESIYGIVAATTQVVHVLTRGR